MTETIKKISEEELEVTFQAPAPMPEIRRISKVALLADKAKLDSLLAEFDKEIVK